MTSKSASESEHWLIVTDRLESEGNYAEAFKHLHHAATLGYPGAQLNLGYWYAAGTAGNADPEQAERWYRRAHDSGHTSAAFNLGLLMLAQNRNEDGRKWLQIACEAQHGEAMLALAKLQEDPAKKMMWLRRSLELPEESFSEPGREEAKELLRGLLTIG